MTKTEYKRRKLAFIMNLFEIRDMKFLISEKIENIIKMYNLVI